MHSLRGTFLHKLDPSFDHACLTRGELMEKTNNFRVSGKVLTIFLLKLLLSMNILNDVTAAPFLVSFSQLPTVKKTPNTVQL